MSAQHAPPVEWERPRCLRCGHAHSRVIHHGRDYLHQLPGEFSVSECPSCGLWFQSPRPVQAEAASLYPADYGPHGEPGPLTLRAGAARYLRRVLGYAHLKASPTRATDWRSWRLLNPARRWWAGVGLIPRFVPNGSLLELGCGSGSRLVHLRQLGWHDLSGVELVPLAAERAASAGFAVQCAPVEEALRTYPDAAFDVVIMSMVIEHLYDPFDVMREIARVIKPGGQFLFSTVVRDAPDAAIYGKYWAGFDFPRHMIYFRMSDIRAMLGGAFRDLERFHHAAPIDYVRSSSWRRNDGAATPFDRVVMSVGGTSAALAASLVLAWLHQMCRVSFRCTRTAHVELAH
jgi:SAM-dependent methyltransferase